MQFGSFGAGSPGAMGLALLKQLQGFNGTGNNAASAPGATDASGMPNFMSKGLIARLMSGNPGGLIGALMNRGNAPVNPGAPPAAGDPAYVGGGGMGPAMPQMQPMGLMSQPAQMPDLGGFNGF